MNTTPSSTPYTKEQAKVHDAVLAEATVAHFRADSRREHEIDSAHRLAGDRKGRARRASAWALTDAEACERVEAIASGGGPHASSARRVLDALTAAEREIDARQAEIAGLEQIWRDRGRWSRFFVVTGGHVHRSRACHTLRPTTRICWLPDLSGESEAEAVAKLGAVLCTVCFPSAPVEWTTQAPKAADPDVCGGSGTYVPNAQRRYRSAWGYCPTCGAWVAVTTTGVARKHKAAAATTT
ncbi:MAG: hypothetical protein AB7G47_19335 [Mycolicibacterium sp.]|uniref:hypothetical protein n=1 Tax=Mycolicibacterium sp. TaxID=2320850 RepID=UPI003D11D4FA